MKKSKTVRMMAATAFLLGVLAVGGGTLAYADTSSTKTDPITTISKRIAQKFNLNASDVQEVVKQVFDEEQKTRETEREQNMKDRLSKAVADGTLTQAQADLITVKQTELASQRQILATMTDAERQAYIASQREALKTWATKNNIPKQYLMMRGFGRHHESHMSR